MTGDAQAGASQPHAEAPPPPETPVTVMISCGEPSGDLYAGALVTELRKAAPGVQIFGLGGDRLAAAGGALVAHYRGLSVTGLAEALRVLPRSLLVYRRLVAEARRRRPAVFVAIDFPDFNFRLAGAMQRLGVPVVYYIAPQLWAWRAGRLQTMKRLVKRVLVIFPFEEALYRDAGVPVEFVGHPLRDVMVTPSARQDYLTALQLSPSAPTVALLPGSRPNEIRAILPDLARAAAHVLEQERTTQFLVARAPDLDDRLFASAASIPTSAVRLVEGQADQVLASADVALVASGTATVQAAMQACPMVVVYRVAPLTYMLGRPFVRVSTYAMVNLVAGRQIVPELIQDGFTPATAAEATLALLTDAQRAATMRHDLADVRVKLGEPGASRRAAGAVLDTAWQDAIRTGPGVDRAN